MNGLKGFFCLGIILMIWFTASKNAYSKSEKGIKCIVENFKSEETAEIVLLNKGHLIPLYSTVVLKKAGVIATLQVVKDSILSPSKYLLSMGRFYDSGSVSEIGSVTFNLNEGGTTGSFVTPSLAVVTCYKIEWTLSDRKGSPQITDHRLEIWIIR